MIKKGWLIYSKDDAANSEAYINWFINEAQAQNISLELIYREDLTIGIIQNKPIIYLLENTTTLPTFAIVRTIEPLLSKHLEDCGVLVFNSSYISRICNHKSLTHQEVNKLNIPMVDTIFVKKENLNDTPPMLFPFVLKESTGRSGKQVYLIHNKNEWKQSIAKLTTSDLVIQACNVQHGKDVRVFIVGKEIVGAVMRSSETQFKANFTLGGSATWYELNDDELGLVHKIIDHFDFGMVGIDFLIDMDGGFSFNEIEDIVGSRILSAESDINILEKYITHIKKHL